MRIKTIDGFLIVTLILTCLSCKFVNGISTPAVTTVTYKNVRYVANLVSSSLWGNPIITYQSANGATTQLQQMNLDSTLQLRVGLTATLKASCAGSYSPAQLSASAAISLKMYVNDSLKASANDFQTDSLTTVNASATCSYRIK